MFLKAIGPQADSQSADMYRAEAKIAAALPAAAPAPRLLWSSEIGGWVTLAFEDIEGAPPTTPWRADELTRVLNAVDDLATTLTPSPIAAAPIEEALGEEFNGWRTLAADAGRGDGLPGLDDWARRHLDRLADLEAGWVGAAAGDTLLHGDLRADNLLLTPDRVVVVDWPSACIGAPWADLLMMLPSVAMQGGPDPECVFSTVPVARGADAEAVDAVLAGLAGFFISNGRRPAPRGLPTLRAFQLAQGREALAWLRRRSGWT